MSTKDSTARKDSNAAPKQGKSRVGRKGYPVEMHDRVIEYLKIGHTDHDAVILAGINPDTFYTWIKEKPEFSEKVKEARLFAKDRALKIIQNAAIRSWTAAAWYLERKHRDEFALKTVNENKEHIIHDFSEESAKRLAKYLPKSK